MTVEITGVKEVQEILDTLAPKYARNLMRSTIHGVAGQITKDAKNKAPVKTGSLKRAIKTKRKKSPPDKPTSLVMVEHGRSAKYDAFYWRFVEYGTLGGVNPMPARPFIGPAAEYVRLKFNTILTQEFGKKLEKTLAREAKKRANK